MKRLLTASFCLLLLIFWQTPFSFGAISANDTFCGNSATTMVVFGNGIMNTRKKARDSRDALRNSLRESLPFEEFSKLEFRVAYNHSYGFMGDLYESLLQRMTSDNFSLSFWRWIGNLEVMPEDVQQFVNDSVASFDISERFGEEDISNHLALYRSGINEGKKVVAVAHSQGNEFVNAAHKVLYAGDNPLPTKSFGIVAVATPASFVAGNGPYTTLFEDIVIKAISMTSGAVATSLPLPSNVTNLADGAENGDWRSHSFSESYMAVGSRSEGRILAGVASVAMSLEKPNQLVQEGVITVTLDWGYEPDVDLHVLEPGGIHVYYSNPQGQYGYLDVDDIDGFGPEHYYATCENLVAGTYRVGVNYFHGFYFEQALVQIKAGSSIRSFRVNLPQARGLEGNENPLDVAEIVVSGDNINGFGFDIRSF